MSAPRLNAASLIWRNRRAQFTRTGCVIAIALVVFLLAIFIVERRALGDSLSWLRRHGVLCAGLAAFLSAAAVAQRRTLMRAQFARSWLAAVPVKRGAARWEAFLIETLPASAAVAALFVGAVLAVPALALQPAGVTALGVVLAYLSGGIVLGVSVSFLMPRPKPLDLPPGSRYVPKPRVNRAAAVRPSLSALGLWPIRQMFAWLQPKLVARAVIPILVMMPMGTTAADAMIVIALFGLLGAMTLLCSAALAVGRAARRWLAPLPLRAAAVFRASLLPACGVIAGSCAIVTLLLLVVNVSYRVAAEIAASAAVAGCLCIGGVLLWNARPRRMQ
jgi:hypothetical protein